MPHKCSDDHTTQEGLAVFEQEDGSITGFCFACDTFVDDPLGGGKAPKAKPKKTAEEIAAQMAEIGKLGCMDLKGRRLRKASLEHFGIKVGVSESDGKTPAFVYQPYYKGGEVVGYKVKHLQTKNTWSVGNQRDVELFGWQQALESGAKRLIVCEGELDCVAMHRILELYTKDSFKEYIPAVVSLPHGAGSAEKDVKRVLKEIKANFTHISICFDEDEAGDKATVAVSKLLPEATTITLPNVKDPNEALIKGMGKQVHKLITFDAKEVKKTRLVEASSLHEEAATRVKEGELTWPWEGMNALTKKLRLGETIFIGAGEKIGKSTIVNQMAANFIKEDDVKVLMIKSEELPAHSYRLLCGQVAGELFHLPDIPFDREAFDKAGEVVSGKVKFVDTYQNLTWDSVKLDIEEAVDWGAQVVFLDPITTLSNGVDAAEANTLLQTVTQEMSMMAKDLNILILIFCHLRNPSQGKSHQEGGRVLSSQFAGSRAMARGCHILIGMEGDKSPDLSEDERNQRRLVLLSERTYGQTGAVDLQYDKNTGRLNEI